MMTIDLNRKNKFPLQGYAFLNNEQRIEIQQHKVTRNYRIAIFDQIPNGNQNIAYQWTGKLLCITDEICDNQCFDVCLLDDIDDNAYRYYFIDIESVTQAVHAAHNQFQHDHESSQAWETVELNQS